MDYGTAFRISAAGMSLEKARVDVTALNIANMNSTKPLNGAGYQPLRVVSATQPVQGFGAIFEARGGAAGLSMPAGVQVEATQAAPRMVHEPGHPDADDRGFVTYPGVNHTGEMVNLVTAMRAYEANVVAMNAAKTMALKALDIGGGS